MRPAVSVRESNPVFDSAYDSPRTRDPILFDPSFISDVGFGNPFPHHVSAGIGIDFPKEQIVTPSIDNENINDFINSVLDLDAYKTKDLVHQGDVYSGLFSPEGSDSPSSIAATSLAQRPISGAPS